MTRNPEYSKVRVLLIEGRARQIMPLMESLHKLGCHVTTFNTTKLDLGYVSHYPDKKILSFCHEKDPERSWECVSMELKTGNYDLVIPLNDFPAIMLSQKKEELKPYVTVAANDWDVFQYASDKLKTMKACMENDVPCPKTFVADESLNDLSSLDLTFPVCIKPRTGYSAMGFRVIENPADLEHIVAATKEKYGAPLIQEYIPQTGLQYKAELFVDKNGDIKSCCMFSKLRWYPLSGGSSSLNKSVYRQDIMENSIKLLKAIGWRGYADFDYIEDPRDGIAKVMEINPRITAGVKLCYMCGVNFSEQIVQDHLNMPVTEYMDYPEGKYLRYMHTDLLWFIKSPERFSSRPSWFDFRNTGDQVWSIKDPLPWFAYTLANVPRLGADTKKRKLDDDTGGQT